MGPNCHLTIRRSDLRGAEVVRGGVNTKIVIEDSRLTSVGHNAEVHPIATVISGEPSYGRNATVRER